MSSIKHITIINQYIGSPNHGMEYRHYYLAKNLLQLGYKVTFVSGSYSHLFFSLPTTKGNFTKEFIDGIEYIWVKVPKYRSSKSLGRIWNMLCYAWKLNFLNDLSPSHILVSSPSLFPVKVGQKLAKKFNTKFLFEVRDIWPLTLVELANISERNPLIQLMKYYEKFAYRYADRVISLLPNAKEYYEANGMSKKKFIYLPNGIELNSFASEPLPQSILDKVPQNKFIVAYCGTIGIANNLDYLVDVAHRLKENNEIHFIILGQGGERDRLKRKVNSLKLNNFTFINAVRKEQVKTFLEKVDLTFISLLPEKLFKFGVSPNKVFEYMYAKKPILWAIDAGNDLVAESNSGKSVPLDDVEKLKDVILELKSLPKEKLKELGQNGYNFVQKHHNYNMLAEKLIRVIEE